MARLPRLSLAGYPHLILQRGNNGQTVFTSATDYEMMLNLLSENSRKFNVDINAYALLPDHFYILATPQSVDGLPLMMQAIGRSYVRWFNNLHGRSGTLWDGRYKSTVIDADRDLLDVMVYMDTSPVRAGLVAQATEYVWTSHAYFIGQGVKHHFDKLLAPHAAYWDLGNTPFAREMKYAELVKCGIGSSRQSEIRDAILKGWVHGTPSFVTKVQELTERRVIKKSAGRPVKSKSISV
ncbi:MAG: transposase [Polaromonas sp.]|nr:transposase [Polaromonas sp.]